MTRQFARQGLVTVGLLLSACTRTAPVVDGGVFEADGGPMAADGGDGGLVEDAGVDAGLIDQLDAGQTDGGHVTAKEASVGVAKVKALLTGLPATDEEVARVAAGAGAMGELVDEWMRLPQYDTKLRHFFVTSFQQDQWSFDDLALLFCQTPPFRRDSALFVQNLNESFARTVQALIAEGKPFNSAMTTTRFMMTPAMMAAYAVLDSRRVNDRYICNDLFHVEHPVALTIQSTTPTTFEEAVNPGSPNFMNFYDPGLLDLFMSSCHGSVSYPAPVEGRILTNYLFSGILELPTQCYQQRPVTSAYMRPEDFTDWRMVQIRKPAPGEATTPLYDVPFMRRSSELVLRIPRVSFFSTPAFATRWPTNDSNLARVLINQTMIVALGEPIDLTNTTAPMSLEALDRAHAGPETTCYQCHQSLDPMRQFFRQTYSLYLSDQDDPLQTAMPGQFAFQGVTGTGVGMADLGAILASHPMFAPAWVQKLCTWATSNECDEGDPEFLRLVAVFVDSQYSWPALVRALMSSPLVTNFFETESSETVGVVVPVAHQGHLCESLSARLGIPDVCARDVLTVPFSSVTKAVASSWPSVQYSRGSASPALTVQPSLMDRGGIENLCADLATRLVDAEGSAFQSTDPTAAINLLTTRLMGLTSDRAAAPKALLKEHLDAAVLAGETPSVALESTFVLACTSPYVVAVGQ